MSFVATLAPQAPSVGALDKKYVKQTYDAMSDARVNLEYVAMQISALPVREQKRFFRLLLNYIDVVSLNKGNPAMQDVVNLCYKLIETINDHYEQLELQFNA